MPNSLEEKGGLTVTEVDREIAFSIVKTLMEAELISEETYVSASSSRFFDKKTLYI